MSVLTTSLKTEIYLKSQDYKLLLSGLFIAIVVILAIPSRGVNMHPLVIDGYSGIYNSAFLGLYSAVLTTFLFLLLGIYLVIGRISMDYTSGVGQILASTKMTTKNYIWSRALSNVLSLLVIDFFSISAAIFMQFLHGESTSFHLLDFLLPHIVFVWPIILLVAMLSILFEMYFRNRLQMVYIGYFFMVLMSLMAIFSLGWDLFGFEVFPTYLEQANYLTNPQDFSLIATTDEAPTLVTYPGLTFSSEILITRLMLLGMTVLAFFLSYVRFDRFDPSRWSITLTKMLQKGKSADEKTDTDLPQSHEDETNGLLHYGDLVPVSRSPGIMQFLIPLRAEWRMTLPRSKLYLATIAITILVSLETESASILSFTLLLVIIPIGKMFARDTNSGTRELLLTIPQSQWKVDCSRFTTAMALLLLVNLGWILGSLGRGDTFGLGLTGLTILFVTALGYGLSNAFQGDKVFLATILCWWYSALNDIPYSDFMFINNQSQGLISLYAGVTLGFALLGIVAGKFRADQ